MKENTMYMTLQTYIRNINPSKHYGKGEIVIRWNAFVSNIHLFAKEETIQYRKSKITSLNITSIWKINVHVRKEIYPVNDKRVKLSDYASCRPRPICLVVNNNCGVPTVQKIDYIITYIWT